MGYLFIKMEETDKFSKNDFSKTGLRLSPEANPRYEIVKSAFQFFTVHLFFYFLFCRCFPIYEYEPTFMLRLLSERSLAPGSARLLLFIPN